jgi:hypothetical protein
MRNWGVKGDTYNRFGYCRVDYLFLPSGPRRSLRPARSFLFLARHIRFGWEEEHLAYLAKKLGLALG